MTTPHQASGCDKSGARPDSGPSPKRRRRKEARPSQIIDAAIRCFLQSGFAGTHMSMVADEAGLSKGSVFRYFKGKDELFRAVARSILEQDLGALHGDLDLDGPLDVLLPALLVSLATDSEQNRIPKFSRLLLEESRRFPALAQTWQQEVSGRTLDVLAAAMAKAQSQGEVIEGNPRVLAFLVTSPMFTARLYAELFGETAGVDALAVAQHQARVLLGGLFTQERAK